MIHLVTVVGNRLDLLPHMLAHYQSLGIDSVLVGIHIGTYDSPLYKEAVEICEDIGATIVGVFVGEWFHEVNPFLYGYSRRRHPNDWFILADVDEFQVYPQGIRSFFDELDHCGFDYVEGCVLDRVARDGALPAVAPDISVWDQFPLAGLVTPYILKAEFLKVVAAKGHVRLTAGQHFALTGRGCPIEQQYIPVHHFKWSGDVLERLKDRAGFYQKINEPIWQESQRCVEHLVQHGGRIDVADPRMFMAETSKGYPHWPSVLELVQRRKRTNTKHNEPSS